MVTKLQRRTASRRKLQFLPTLSNSKSVKRSSIILKVLLRCHKLKVKLEQIHREYQNLIAIRNQYFTLLKHIQIPKEVKVGKVGEEFVVKVSCKGGDKLISILEAFEEVGLNVVQATVSSTHFFAMEAIAVADQDQQTTDIKHVTQAILKAIEKQGG